MNDSQHQQAAPDLLQVVMSHESNLYRYGLGHF